MNKKGYILLWSVVILMVVSMVVFSHANTVSTNYNIVQSIYRSEYATQAAFGGLELAIEHYENNPNEIYEFSNNATIGASIELYPDINGDLTDYLILENYHIENIIAEKIDDGIVRIVSKSIYEKAAREISAVITTSETNITVNEIIIN
ncbi:MAG: hypothetical protein ACOCRO_03050 [Halanaerobiales bacterium]